MSLGDAAMTAEIVIVIIAAGYDAAFQMHVGHVKHQTPPPRKLFLQIRQYV